MIRSGGLSTGSAICDYTGPTLGPFVGLWALDENGAPTGRAVSFFNNGVADVLNTIPTFEDCEGQSYEFFTSETLEFFTIVDPGVFLFAQNPDVDFVFTWTLGGFTFESKDPTPTFAMPEALKALSEGFGGGGAARAAGPAAFGNLAASGARAAANITLDLTVRLSINANENFGFFDCAGPLLDLRHRWREFGGGIEFRWLGNYQGADP
ncbi:hypothetical protein JCM17843_20420 [Kordiimonadales bacterium JCM 17843]|nr:hypothetical protein JCM17843_20420 [Kordiimonadales bacterium JCM 17843]